VKRFNLARKYDKHFYEHLNVALYLPVSRPHCQTSMISANRGESIVPIHCIMQLLAIFIVSQEVAGIVAKKQQ
jgi:hypothetical protein